MDHLLVWGLTVRLAGVLMAVYFASFGARPPIQIIQIILRKWWQQLPLGPSLPRAPGARMTVVNQLPQNNTLWRWLIKVGRKSIN